MSVRPHQPWGTNAPMPAGTAVASTDRAISRAVEAAWRDGGPVAEFGLVGGDLRRALGGRRDAESLRSPDAVRAVIDVGELIVGGQRFAFVAHVLAHSRFYAPPALAIMNAEFRGDWLVAPRAHPGDGWFDVIDARLGRGERLKARARLATGAHVPHPRIRQRRSRGERFDLAKRRTIAVDGEAVAKARQFEIRLHPAALVVYV